MFKKLDETILSTATKIAHGLQRATGLTTYFIARIGVFLAILSLVLDAINYVHQFLPFKTTAGFLYVGSVVMLGLIWRSWAVQKAEDSIGSNTKPIALLPHTTEHYGWRIFWFFASIWSLIGFPLSHPRYPFLEFLNRTGFSLGVFLFSYFIIVDPLPPGTSKVREWLHNLLHPPQLATQESKS